MNFFQNFMENVKRKKAELDDRRAFLDMVDEKAKPLRRAAYMKQAILESVGEGIAKAKLDAEKRIPKKKDKTPGDFGIKENPKDEKDQWAYLDEIGKQMQKSVLTEPKEDKTLTKSNKKKK